MRAFSLIVVQTRKRAAHVGGYLPIIGLDLLLVRAAGPAQQHVRMLGLGLRRRKASG